MENKINNRNNKMSKKSSWKEPQEFVHLAEQDDLLNNQSDLYSLATPQEIYILTLKQEGEFIKQNKISIT